MRKNKKLMMFACMSALLLSGCKSTYTGRVISETQGNGQYQYTLDELTGNKFEEEDLAGTWDAQSAEKIQLADTSITYSGSNAVVEGNTITIQKAGVYELSGSLTDGQVVVDTKDQEKVQLVLNGANINSQTTAPIYIKHANKTVVTIADGTENVISDSAESKMDDVLEGYEAAIYSNGQLIINGNGSMTVIGNKANGIECVNDLKFASGFINVQSAANGIESSKAVSVKNGAYTVTSGAKAFVAGQKEDKEAYVGLEGGTFTVNSEKDAIASSGNIYVLNGIYQIATGKGAQTEDAKGLVSGESVEIYGGSVTLNTADDAISSGRGISIDSGNVNINSLDDGIHADNTININGGSVVLSQCNYGLTSSFMNLTGGYLNVVSAADAINISGGVDSSGLEERLGKNNFDSTEKGVISIDNIYVSLEAAGDGMDINGDLRINGGNVIVTGTEDPNHHAINVSKQYLVNGGILIASDMAKEPVIPANESGQPVLVKKFDAPRTSDQVFYVEDSSQNSVVSFSSKKQYTNLIVSKPEIEMGKLYTVYDGTVTQQTDQNGEVSSDNYTKGEKISDFTPTEKIIQLDK